MNAKSKKNHCKTNQDSAGQPNFIQQQGTKEQKMPYTAVDTSLRLLMLFRSYLLLPGEHTAGKILHICETE